MKKAIIYMLLLMPLTVWAAKNGLKPRLVVCTDIAPADVEPDDMESMVRLMAYADCFEIEALITSVGWNCDPYPLEWQQYLFRVITAYAKDVPNLMRRSGQKGFQPIRKENGQQELGYWPSAEYITSRAVMGSMYGGIKAIGERNPQIVIAPLQITAKAGDTIRLDASKSFDPDGDALRFLWWQQPEIGRTKVTIDQSNQSTVTLHIPTDTKGDTIHLICEVHDDGPFHLVAYRRIIVSIK